MTINLHHLNLLNIVKKVLITKIFLFHFFYFSLAEKAEQERAELESMAENLRGINCSARAESVNLDNLFDFLADVPAQRGAPDGQPAHQPTINEIGDSIERLADDLNQEVSYNINTLCVPRIPLNTTFLRQVA